MLAEAGTNPMSLKRGVCAHEVSGEHLELQFRPNLAIGVLHVPDATASITHRRLRAQTFKRAAESTTSPV